MFEQAFKNIDDVLWKEAGCTTELDYNEQTSWLLFLKYLDGLEQDRAMEAELEGHPHIYLLEEPYRWESWAAPKGADGRLDHIDELRFRSQTEKHELSHVIAIMNMILHGIEAPNIQHTNTLADIQEKDRMDVILANPPFGGKERKEVQQNFPIRTGETAFLFLQHFIKMLKAGGRAAVVIKNTFLSNTDNASVSLRKLLLESCNLHTVLDCPGGTFQGSGVKTVVLFFEKGSPTRTVWYYQLTPSTSSGQARNLGKTNPPQRRRPTRVCRTAKDLCRFTQKLEPRCSLPERSRRVRSVGEEPEWRRGSHPSEPTENPGRDRCAGCGGGRRFRHHRATAESR
jgi:hypothetical protein